MAQDEQGGLYLGAMGTYLEPNAVRALEGGVGAQVFAGWMPTQFPGWAAELTFSFNELDQTDGVDQDEISQLGLDLIKRFSSHGALTPYAAAGLAASFEKIRGERVTQPQLGLGGGLLLALGDTAWSLRLDGRALVQKNDYDKPPATSDRSLLLDGRLGFGLQYSWQKAATTMVAQQADDADRDGVRDADDLCPETLPGAQVDRTGCEALQGLDSDADGVSDRVDRCPATAAGDNVDAQGCSQGASVELKGVNFEFNSAHLTEQAKDILRPVAQLLTTALSNVDVEIAGHTDNIGGDDYNQALSARRAWAVKNFLAELGVAPERMIATGYGASQPIADNDKAPGREKNRRVVFRVVE